MWVVTGIVTLLYLVLLALELVSDRKSCGQYYNFLDSISNLMNMI